MKICNPKGWIEEAGGNRGEATERKYLSAPGLNRACTRGGVSCCCLSTLPGARVNMDNYIFLLRFPSFHPDPEIARATDPSESRDAVLYEALHFRVVTQAGVVTCGRG